MPVKIIIHFKQNVYRSTLWKYFDYELFVKNVDLNYNVNEMEINSQHISQSYR